MTREEAKRRAELYLALAEGKAIKVQSPYTGEWEYLDINKFDEFKEGYNYRIKPEQKYRPFKSQEECWQEMHKHPDFGWVINEGVYMIVQSIYNDEIYTAELLDNIDYKYAVENLIFTDGTPFGIKEG